MSSRINQISDVCKSLLSILPVERQQIGVEQKLNCMRSTFESTFKEDNRGIQEVIISENEQRYIQLDQIRKDNYILAKGLPSLDKKNIQCHLH